ncbi:MAG TPA: FG-GAP-like repeat-containing protein [Cyclobacteriaceae bacterium]|nr:FG-GAP-like repeat-containing protein [Cyclobacteriaceae bacterium]
MEVLPYGGSPVLLIGAYNAIWVSPDNGINWYKNYDHGLCACDYGYVYDFAQDPSTGYFYATIYGPNGGVLISYDGGTSWSLINNTDFTGLPVDFWANKLAITTSGKILVSTYGNGLWESVDGGLNWTANPDFTDYTLYDVAASSNGKVFLSSYGNLYQSLDNSVSWEQIQWVPNTLNSLAISPTNNLFASTSYQTLYKSQLPVNQLFTQDISGLVSSSNFPLKNSSVSWGDFDNDGDLDFCAVGTDAGNTDVFNIYGNEINNLYIYNDQALTPSLRSATARWFDFNNDGFLDLMSTGYNSISGQNVTTLYKNDNGSLYAIPAGFAGLGLSSFDFGDLNRDGWNDVILCGRDPVTLEAKTIIYYNNWDESFTASPDEIIGLHSGIVALADFNNDGYLDVFITGTDGSSLKSAFYKYDPEIEVFKIQSDLATPGLINASADWGDFDADGDLDLAVMGNDGSNQICRIYATGSISLHADISATALNGGTAGSVHWGDYDGDGDLDLLAGSSLQTVVLQNNAGDFSTVVLTLPGLGTRGQARFGDINSDGSLDILTTAGLYKVFPAQSNNAPSVPSNISSIISGYEATLNWSASSDNETPSSALTYNVQVVESGFFDDEIVTPPGEYYTVFPGENISGLTGNAEQNLSFKIPYMDPGVYLWRVQAVDGSLNTSDWSALYNFTMTPQPPDAPYNLQARVTNYTDIELSWTDASNDETGFRLERSTDNYTFIEIATEGAGTGDLTADVTTYTDQGLSQGTVYYYRVRSTNANGQSAYSDVITGATLSGNVGDPAAWAWVTSAYGEGRTFVNDLDIAFDDNLYVTGSYKNYITIQSVTEGIASGDDGFFIGDISLGGNINWIPRLDNSSNLETGVQIAIDNTNYQHYILESFTNTFTSSGNTYNPTTVGESDFLLYCLPYYIDVPPLFTIQITKTGYSEGIFMEMMPDGNLIIAGNTMNSISIGGIAVNIAKINNGFIAKIDPTGNILWAKIIFETDGTGNLTDLNIDDNGNIYLSGNFTSAMNLGGVAYASPNGGHEVFIAKLDTDGNLVWENQSSGAGTSDQMYAIVPGNIALGADMGIYAAGVYGNTISFNGDTLTTSGTMNSFLVKYDPSGAFKWVKSIGDQNEVNNIETLDMAADENENIYITGYLAGAQYSIGGRTLYSSEGSEDMFVARYDSSGNLIWIKNAGGPGTERGRKIILDNHNDIFVTGTFTSSNPPFGVFNLTGYYDGFEDVFVGKLNQTDLLAIPDLELKITSQTPAIIDKDYPQFRVNYRVWNHGDIASPATSVRMLQSPDFWFDLTPNDNTQPGDFSLQSLNPGDSADFSETVTLSNLEDRLRFRLFANPDNDFIETTRENNYVITLVDDNEPSHRVPVLQDAYVDESQPETYFGEIANMIVNENPESAASRWGLIKFDIDDINISSNFTKLMIYGKTDPTNLANVFDFDVDLYGTAGSDWGSRLDPDSIKVTWNNKPALGPWLATASFNDADNYVEFENDTLAEFVNNAILNGDSLISFYILGKNITGVENVQIYTQETAGNSVYTQLYMDNRPADLKFSYANISNTTVFQGVPVNLNGSFYNESNASINIPTRIAVYVSSDTLLDVSDTELISNDLIGWCSYCYYSINQDYTFDFSLSTGNYYVLFVLDPDNQVNETYETNNIKYAAFTLNAGTAPDLTIQNQILAPGIVRPGSLLTASCVISNNGSAHLTIPTLFHIYLSSDALFDISDVLMYEKSLSSINMGESIAFSDTVRISALADGIYYFLFFADAGEASIELDEENNVQNVSFEVNSTADITKPIISNPTRDPVDPVPGFGNMTFSVDVTDEESPISQVIFSYNAIMTDTTSWITPSMTNASGSTYTISILESSFQNVGLRYRVLAEDNAGNIAITPNQYLYLNKTVDAETIATTKGTSQSAYRIISIPYDLQSWTVNAIFEDDFGSYDNTKWRLFRYDNSNYAELSSGSATLARGRGYFLISKEVASFDVGAGTIPNEKPGGEYTISLTTGWNLIGNPYLFNVAWDDILAYSSNPGRNIGQPKKWEGNWIDAQGLKTFSGVFVMSDGNAQLTIPVLQSSTSLRTENASTALKNSLDLSDWEVNLRLSDGNMQNEFGGIGMRTDASPGFDRYDDFTLPRLFEYLELNHDLKFAGINYTKNVVPSAEEYSWNFDIETSDPDKIITLGWDNSYWGNGKRLTLVDEANQAYIDMSLVNSYSFKPGMKNNFRIVYSGNDYDPGNILFTAYPNPFEDETRFGFRLPENMHSKVDINVFNPLGSQVNKLFDGILPGGYHELSWDGSDVAGHNVPSGLYIIAMKINSSGLTRNASIQVVRK